MMLARSYRRVVAALAVGALLTAGASPASAATSAGWRLFATVSPHNSEVQLNAVTAVSRSDAWAVGPSGTSGASIVEHWNGRTWLQATVPASVLKRVSTLSYVSALSASSVWAMDMEGNWLHFNGKRWSAGRLPAPRGHGSLFIESTRAVSRHGMWVLGWASGSTTIPYAAFYNGSKWQLKKLPAPATHYVEYGDLSALAPGNVWALLGNAAPLPSSNVLMHWNGRRWYRVGLPSSLVKGAQLITVLALKDGAVWVGGFVPHGSGSAVTTTAVVARLAGGAWHVSGLPAPTPTPGPDTAVDGMVSDGQGGIWAFGSESGTDLGPIWHSQSGRWSTPSYVPGTPSGRFVASESMALIPGTTAVWGVGGMYGAKAQNNEIGAIVVAGNPRA